MRIRILKYVTVFGKLARHALFYDYVRVEAWLMNRRTYTYFNSEFKSRIKLIVSKNFIKKMLHYV